MRQREGKRERGGKEARQSKGEIRENRTESKQRQTDGDRSTHSGTKEDPLCNL